MLVRTLAIATMMLFSGGAMAECLHDDQSDVKIRVQDQFRKAYSEACAGKPADDLEFLYFGTWTPTEADDSELVAHQAFQLSNDASGKCQAQLVDRMQKDAESGVGPHCSHYRIQRAEWFPQADSGPSLLFFMKSDLDGDLPAAEADIVLYDQGGGQLVDGHYGQIARIQKAVNEKLQECGLGGEIGVDGKFGGGTKKAIRRLTGCKSVGDTLPKNSPARGGAMTTALWKILFGNTPPPSVDSRSVAILLAYEATDYDDAEWNFCQNRPLYDPANGQKTCYSNDKRSYLTWGPHGATAGHGQEVLAIAALVDDAHPEILDDAFGSEAKALRRAIRLDDPESGNGELERFLCAKWVDVDQRRAWKTAFAKFGSHDEVRQTYDRLYRSTNFDGGKMKIFFDAWKEAGLQPTEIDYAFFVDRSAHMTSKKSTILNAIENAQSAAEGDLSPAEIRRAVSLAVLPGNKDQRVGRLGRDVTFYIDALDDQLTNEEREAWSRSKKLKASEAGLSDDRLVPDFKPEAAIKWKPADHASLTPKEASSCPSAVLDPLSPP